MSPRSLLFSSDQEASLVLGQVLRTTGLEVEHCPEIFSAVEQLTAHTFDIIAADLDDGAEADFLLKTSRDLNSNRNALRIALTCRKVDGHSGVDLILSKPLTPDRVRATLLKSEAFLGRLKTLFPGKTEENTAPATEQKKQALPEASSPIAATEVAQAIPLAETSSAQFKNRVSAAKVDASLSWKAQRKLESHNPLEGHLRTPSRRPPPSRATVVRQVLLGAVMLLLVYVGIRPAKGEALVTSVAVIYEKAVRNANDWLRQPAHKEEVAEITGDVPVPVYQPPRVTHIEVKRPSSLPPQVFVGTTDPLPILASSEDSEPVAASQPANPSGNIPESLKSTFAADDASQADAVRPTHSDMPLADFMEPVTLPENQSQKLLLQKVVPSYPEQALKSGLQGPVTLQARIGRDGKIQDLKVVSGYLVLGEAATAAVQQWRYKPYLVNGRPVETKTTITVDFRLPQMVSTAVPER